MNKVIRLFQNADLRCAHDGLGLLARDHKIDVSKLQKGEFIMFINRRKNQLKAFAAGNIVAHLKTVDGHRLDLNVIQKLPTYFSGGSFKYDEALGDMFEQKLRKAS